MKASRALQIVSESVKNSLVHKDIAYIIETKRWAVFDEGSNIIQNLEGLSARLSTVVYGIRNSIVHYGSINTFMSDTRIRLPHKSNKVVVTWFHVVPDAPIIKRAKEADTHVDCWHTSCQSTYRQMLDMGIPSEKIVIIPIGLDLSVYTPVTADSRNAIRKSLGIPDQAIVIGSFQKDGEGWGEGNTPKWIKGPDFFCDIIETIAKKTPNIYVLLTGPARGYVKNRLTAAGIPFKHLMLKEAYEVGPYYHALDYYFVASREEGGPKALPNPWPLAFR